MVTAAADILDERHAGNGWSSDRLISVVKWRVMVAAKRSVADEEAYLDVAV